MRTRTCPRCNTDYVGWPALSRRDNRTDICPGCGTEEALVDAQIIRSGQTREADIILARDKRFRERVAKEEEERP